MNSNETTAVVLDHDFNSSSARSYRKWRHIKDVATRYLMAFGGVSVIAAIVLIAFYLLYVVVPMFKSAEIEKLPRTPCRVVARAKHSTLRWKNNAK